MIGGNARLLELKRRVQADPASTAFAELAEECRRCGHNEEAVNICRDGLAHHPGYLPARLTLGRALIELGCLDEAGNELGIVVAATPDNLAAHRALAEIHLQRGQMVDALERYRLALQLAKHDPSLDDEVARLASALSSPSAVAVGNDPPRQVEDVFNFDTLLEQFSAPTSQPERRREAPLVTAGPSALDIIKLSADDSDPLALLEQQLRRTQAHRPDPNDVLERQRRGLAELEEWLAAILQDRHTQPSI